MSFRINQVSMSGNIAEPKFFPTKNGSVVAELNVCINDKYTDKSGQEVETIDWFRWKAIGKYGSIIQQMGFQKGDSVVFFGRASQSKWQDKDGSTKSQIEFIASSIMKVDRAKKTTAGNYAAAGGTQESMNMEKAPAAELPPGAASAEDLPF
jgi:single stranded DNA-binding protein